MPKTKSKFGFDDYPLSQWRRVSIPPGTDARSARSAAAGWARNRGLVAKVTTSGPDLYACFAEDFDAVPEFSPEVQGVGVGSMEFSARLTAVVEATRQDSREFEKPLSEAWRAFFEAVPCPRCRVASGPCVGNRVRTVRVLWGVPDNLIGHPSRYAKANTLVTALTAP